MKRILLLAVCVAGSIVVNHSPSRVVAAQDAELDALLAEAQKLLEKQKVDEAIVVLKKMVAKAPTNERLLAALSDLERQTGAFKEGIAHGQQAIKLNDK